MWNEIKWEKTVVCGLVLGFLQLLKRRRCEVNEGLNGAMLGTKSPSIGLILVWDCD